MKTKYYIIRHYDVKQSKTTKSRYGLTGFRTRISNLIYILSDMQLLIRAYF